MIWFADTELFAKKKKKKPATVLERFITWVFRAFGNQNGFAKYLNFIFDHDKEDKDTELALFIQNFTSLVLHFGNAKSYLVYKSVSMNIKTHDSLPSIRRIYFFFWDVNNLIFIIFRLWRGFKIYIITDHVWSVTRLLTAWL